MHPLFHPLFIDYCAYFNGNHDYFECHEVLEDYWKQIAPGEKNHPLVGYIQIATGMYHWRRNNIPGALRMLQKGSDIIRSNRTSPFFSYIDTTDLLSQCNKSIDSIHQGLMFRPFPLKIRHPLLHMKMCEKIDSLPLLSEQFLLHKHMLRDRTDILKSREQKRIRLKNK